MIDKFEQYVISYTARCGCGRKKEAGDINYCYYAYIILLMDNKMICRYVESTKEKYDKCIKEYPEPTELDKITAQVFFGEYIYGQPVLYEGIYNPNLFRHTLKDIKDYFGKEAPEDSKNQELLAWEKICKKEYRNVKIFAIVTTIILLIMIILKITMKEVLAIQLLFLLSLVFFATPIIYLIYMMVEKKIFLKLDNIKLISNQILHSVVVHTPTEVVTKRFIIKRLNITKPIDLSQVCWVYRKRILSSSSAPDQIVMWMKNGKKATMNYRISFSESEIYKLAQMYNPDVIIGWSSHNKKAYKNILCCMNGNNKT